MNKYRGQVLEEDFAGMGLGWDGEDPTYHKVWKLFNRQSHKKDREVLEDFVAPTEKQFDFLVHFSGKSLDFVATRTRKEAAKIISSIVDGWKEENENMRRWYGEEIDEGGFMDPSHLGG